MGWAGLCSAFWAHEKEKMQDKQKIRMYFFMISNNGGSLCRVYWAASAPSFGRKDSEFSFGEKWEIRIFPE